MGPFSKLLRTYMYSNMLLPISSFRHSPASSPGTTLNSSSNTPLTPPTSLPHTSTPITMTNSTLTDKESNQQGQSKLSTCVHNKCTNYNNPHPSSFFLKSSTHQKMFNLMIRNKTKTCMSQIKIIGQFHHWKIFVATPQRHSGAVSNTFL